MLLTYSKTNAGVLDCNDKNHYKGILITTGTCSYKKEKTWWPLPDLKGPFQGAYFWRGLYLEGLIYGGKFAFQIDWGTLIVGTKLTIFALFFFVFEGNFLSTSSRGASIWRGNLMKGFLCSRFGRAYIWRGLFSESYGKYKRYSSII